MAVGLQIGFKKHCGPLHVMIQSCQASESHATIWCQGGLVVKKGAMPWGEKCLTVVLMMIREGVPEDRDMIG
jgi:hypothetical protein